MATFVLLAAAHVGRSALVSQFDGDGRAARLWPDHPKVTGAAAMREVALAAARGAEPAPATLARFDALAADDPLAPEPFLAKAALAVRRGDYPLGEALLLHARMLDPRSPSARYLLADLHLRQDRPLQAMAEMSSLNRLVPAGSMSLAEAFAQYVAKAGAAGQVREILSAYPELAGPVLGQLAANARNADLVLALHGSGPGSEPPAWLPTLVNALLEAGEHPRAFEAWRRSTRAPASPGQLFNPGFDASEFPPPFNWTLAKGSAAVVEPGAGGLNILYFGREDVVLAEQVLLLAPGRYRLATHAAGNTGGNDIRWSVECLRGSGKLLDLPVRAAGAASTLSGEFAVPPGCPAQRLALVARGREFPERADFRVGRLVLGRAGSR